MSDIEKSFAFLSDSIPQWLQSIKELEEKVTAMQQHVVRAPVSTSPFAKRRTDSVESIKHDRMGAIGEESAPSQSAQTDSMAGRKRKTLSVNSGRSGPSRYRPRTMVVVKYDGDVQKSFEVLVRAVGTGRNMLRKAKMEAKMNELAALAGPSDDEDDATDDDEAIMAKVSYRPRMTSMRTRQHPSSGAVTPAAIFDTTDKTLEHAQVLCEKAAHLLLRDGDCRTELGGMKKSFSDVLETAKIEVTKCTVARAQQPQAVAPIETSDAPLTAEPSYKKHFPQLSRPPPSSETPAKSMLPSAPLVVAPTNSSKVMEIEVDDDDEDDEPEFVMPVRFTSRFQAVRA